MSKRSTQGSSRPPSDARVALLPPRLQPLSAEQRAEAAALLSDLLLAAARQRGDSRDSAAAHGELGKEELAA